MDRSAIIPPPPPPRAPFPALSSATRTGTASRTRAKADWSGWTIDIDQLLNGKEVVVETAVTDKNGDFDAAG